ncbi:TetR/AcrR family transcriptional regulator [Paenibacillus psychroresistens]|uniref:TetR/AcrR family transcriptional regulator n=1 Tax=Paenibacillus psychroresistens TaxID=1778678 RepID=A0A6B8RIR0_9BACL|nr:TetR/AcrR family transcriptional regulator [Paenibacillus psychroresistens]QGQ96150.1 TetR/AcrR family transcriptional regulator [Paenibacillus psychroresistens]
MIDKKKLHILSTALDVFFKYGYNRVSMNEIAEAAGISRPGLYLYFKSKKEIFSASILQYGDSLIEEISDGLSSQNTIEDKIHYAFEVWSINKFEDSLTSLEVKEITDSSHLFALEALNSGYRKFEVILTSLLEAHFKSTGSQISLSPQELAYILTSALRGFKIVAKSSTELRKLVHDLLGIIL